MSEQNTSPEHFFRVTLRMEVHPGRGPDFERVWRESAGTITGQAANLGQWLSASLEEKDVYYIVSDWTDEQRFREYERSAEHLEHRSRLHPYRRAGSMTTMRVVGHLTGQAVTARTRVLVHARVPEDATGADAVTTAYHHISKALRGTPGLLGNELLRSRLDPRCFVVMSEWESLEAFQRWEQGPGHRETTAPLRPYQDASRGRPFDVLTVSERY
ncbi:antibiotic biosynthesis monooxygenase family protein [Streptomyces sp. NPDC001709]